MSDTVARAAQARTELQLTGAAFDVLRARLVDEALAATQPDAAYDAVLAVRALDSVRVSLQSVVDTHEIEAKMEENS